MRIYKKIISKEVAYWFDFINYNDVRNNYFYCRKNSMTVRAIIFNYIFLRLTYFLLLKNVLKKREKSLSVIEAQYWSQPPHSGSDSNLGTTGASALDEDGGLDRKRPTAKVGGRVVLQDWMDDCSRLCSPSSRPFYFDVTAVDFMSFKPTSFVSESDRFDKENIVFTNIDFKISAEI